MALAGFSAGEAEGLRRAMSRKRSEAALNAYGERFVAGAVERGRRARGRRAGLRAGARLLGLRLSQVARGRLRPARLPVDLAARPLRARVPLRAAQRAADGLLPARRARPRGAAARDRGPRRRREPQRRRVHGRDARTPAASPAVRIGLGYVKGVGADEARGAGRRARARRRPIATSPSSPRARAPGATGSSGSPGPAPASRSGTRRAGAPRRDELWRLGVARGSERRRGERPRPARAAARPPRAARPAPARLVGADRRRLLLDRDDARRAPDGGAAPGARRRAGR